MRSHRGPDTVRAPDVAFVAAERLGTGEIPTGFLEMAPDLVVEVVSPSDSANAVQAKVDDWLGAGTWLVWVVDPRASRSRGCSSPYAPPAGSVNTMAGHSRGSLNPRVSGSSSSVTATPSFGCYVPPTDRPPLRLPAKKAVAMAKNAVLQRHAESAMPRVAPLRRVDGAVRSRRCQKATPCESAE